MPVILDQQQSSAKPSKKESKDKKSKKDEKKKTKSSSSDKSKSSKKSSDSSESKKRKRSSENTELSGEKKKKKKTSSDDIAEQSAVQEETLVTGSVAPKDPEALSSYRISPETQARLTEKGIVKLFPIQSATFDLIYDGNDVIGRARTGTGKTLSFALPVIERLAKDQVKATSRGPVVLVMCPTRELAKQVAGEFERVSDKFKVLTVYGGVPYWDQEQGFRRGVDIVVGTPGRITDHLERGNLNLSEIKYAILDEADQMLDIGFADAMEKILNAIKDANSSKVYQTLLFSATLPSWVHDVTRKYLRKEFTRTVDLIGNEKLKTNENITHYAIQCPWQQRAATLGDVLRMYGGGSTGRAIVFTETKNEANELALGDKLSKSCQVLHGDIAQKQREITLQSFRDGRIRALIATDVAARGLDIPEVDLVIQCNPPKDVDTFVHRSGRTGRAGMKGVCITFFKATEEWCIQMIQKKTGINFQRIGAPQVSDMVRSSTEDVVKTLQTVDNHVVPLFLPMAEEIINGTKELSHLEACSDEADRSKVALALCLAMLTGTTKMPKSRSLLNSQEGMTTFIMKFKQPMRALGYVRSILQNQFPEISREDWKSFRMTKDQCAALFDINCDIAKDLVEKWNERANSPNTTFEIAQSVPELQERDDSFGRQNQGGPQKWQQQRSGGGGYGGNANRYSNNSGYNRNSGFQRRN